MESSVIIVLLASALFSFLLNKILLKFSHNLGVHNQSDGTLIRWGSTSKPTIGGVSFYITFILSALVLFVIFGTSDGFSNDFLALLIVVTLGFLIGLSDDAYNTRPMLKLLGQISCGVIMIGFGVYIRLFDVPALDYLLTVFWVVGIMNSINLLDNMDGVTATVSLVIITIILVVMNLYNIGYNPFYYTLAATAGAMVGFLILNWKPSKIYMGDTGSQFLGVLLAFIGVKYLWNIRNLDDMVVTSMQIITPVMTFLVPIMDTTFVTYARIARGQSPFVGGKDHLTHHMTFIGVKESRVPLLLGLVSFLSGMLAIFSVKYVFQWNHYFTAIFSGYVVISFAIFFYLYKRGEKVAYIKQRFSKTLASAYSRQQEAELVNKPAPQRT